MGLVALTGSGIMIVLSVPVCFLLVTGQQITLRRVARCLFDRRVWLYMANFVRLVLFCARSYLLSFWAKRRERRGPKRRASNDSE